MPIGHCALARGLSVYGSRALLRRSSSRRVAPATELVGKRRAQISAFGGGPRGTETGGYNPRESLWRASSESDVLLRTDCVSPPRPTWGVPSALSPRR